MQYDNGVSQNGTFWQNRGGALFYVIISRRSWAFWHYKNFTFLQNCI